jgi:hypothetical protein
MDKFLKIYSEAYEPGFVASHDEYRIDPFLIDLQAFNDWLTSGVYDDNGKEIYASRLYKRYPLLGRDNKTIISHIVNFYVTSRIYRLTLRKIVHTLSLAYPRQKFTLLGYESIPIANEKTLYIPYPKHILEVSYMPSVTIQSEYLDPKSCASNVPNLRESISDSSYYAVLNRLSLAVLKDVSVTMIETCADDEHGFEETACAKNKIWPRYYSIPKRYTHVEQVDDAKCTVL